MSRCVWSPGPTRLGAASQRPASPSARPSVIVAVLRREGPLDSRTLRASRRGALLGAGALRARPAPRGARRARAPRGPPHVGGGRLNGAAPRALPPAARGRRPADRRGNAERDASVSSARGSSPSSSRRKTRWLGDRGGELDAGVLAGRIECGRLLGDVLGGDLGAVGAERLLVVLEGLQQILEAGAPVGVDHHHGTGGMTGGERDGPGVDGENGSVPDMATIAALGTGVMGAPMARNLARAGHDVRAWNRSADKAAPLRDDGVDVRDRPGGRARRAPTWSSPCSSDADAVLDVARRARLAEGQIWWQASTIGIDGIEQCAALAQDDRCHARRRAGPRHAHSGRGGQARDPRLRARRGARRVRAALRRGRAAHHAHRAGGDRHAPEARGQHVGPGRRRRARPRPSPSPRRWAWIPPWSSTRSRAARSTSPTSA